MTSRLTALLVALLMALPAWAEEVAEPIPLRANLRFIIQPTLLGLVPLPEAEGYGEALVWLLNAGDEHLYLRYEIKELVTTDAGSGEVVEWWDIDNLPEEAGELTRIRRGNVRAQRNPTSNRITCPLFWGVGDWDAADGLLWLNRDELLGLQENNAIDWFYDSWGALSQQTSESLRDELYHSFAAGTGPAQEQCRLELLEARSYSCYINGELLDLPALHAVDSWGVAEYWILADPANPLVLKVSYQPSNDNGNRHSLAGLLANGAGYAITRIDY